MPVTLYQYSKCSTCRKAIQFLNGRKIDYRSVDITENPPSARELKQMLAARDGDIRKLFNTSGQLYRELKIKDRLGSMSEEEALKLLSKNGKLIKRPFLLTDTGGLIGFNESEWKKAFGSGGSPRGA